jgi:hypothetical protein
LYDSAVNFYHKNLTPIINKISRNILLFLKLLNLCPVRYISNIFKYFHSCKKCISFPIRRNSDLETNEAIRLRSHTLLFTDHKNRKNKNTPCCKISSSLLMSDSNLLYAALLHFRNQGKIPRARGPEDYGF